METSLQQWLLLITLAIQAIGTIIVAATFVVYWKQLTTMNLNVKLVEDQLGAMKKNVELAEQQINIMREATMADRILTVMNSLDSIEVRDARRILLADLSRKEFRHWSTEDIAKASVVASSYNSAGTLTKLELIPLDTILDTWGQSLRDCHAVLSRGYIPDLEYRAGRSPYWPNLNLLAELATQRFGQSPLAG